MPVLEDKNPTKDSGHKRQGCHTHGILPQGPLAKQLHAQP